jgi:hypothetical protein
MQQRWQQAEGRRHILPSDLVQPIVAGRPFLTLCGSWVIPAVADIIPAPWFDGTCLVCQATFIAADAANGGQ